MPGVVCPLRSGWDFLSAGDPRMWPHREAVFADMSSPGGPDEVLAREGEGT